MELRRIRRVDAEPNRMRGTMTNKSRSIAALLPIATIIILVFGTSAFGQAGTQPQPPTQRTARGFPMGDSPEPRTGPAGRLPDAPGEAFTGLPGARRVQPPGGKQSEERILTITDGFTGKEYRVPYTVEIMAEQTPDGAVRGQAAIPAADVIQAAIDRVIPADEQAEMRKPKAQRQAEAAARNSNN
jgi:hypothetical protein